MSEPGENNRLKHINIAPKATKSGKPINLVGMGLDSDGHKRITQGEKFHLQGGTAKTHDAMTETVVKTVESLKKKGRDLGSADPKEVVELLHKHNPEQ